MELTINSDGFVSDFSLKSKLSTKNLQGEPLPGEITITPALQHQEKMPENEYQVRLNISIKTELFDLSLEHRFFIKFDKTLTKQELNSSKTKNLIINNLYPYSRAFIVSTLANGGYGAINMPTFTIAK
jgi:preprotein translocase subunit secB|nr:MAG TPA: Preprotein translocase subunit SecB [Caudoviricetes sp.]